MDEHAGRNEPGTLVGGKLLGRRWRREDVREDKKSKCNAGSGTKHSA